MSDPVQIKIIEVLDDLTTTGRHILMLSDSPLFVSLGDKGRIAVQTGFMGIPSKMFEELINLIQESGSG